MGHCTRSVKMNLLTYNDRRFLRSIHIDPESTLLEDAQDILQAPPQFLPQVVYLSHEAYADIKAKFGEVNMETWAKWYGYRI